MAHAVRLWRIRGSSRRSGTDQHDCEWTEFEVDAFAEQLPGTCRVCGAELLSGWRCLDDGTEVCDQHVLIRSEARWS